jgi:hypothetical protein
MIVMENINIKTFDWNNEQFLRLIQNFQEKCWKDGLEKGKSFSKEEIAFLRRLYPESELFLGAYYQKELLAVLGAGPCNVKFNGEPLKAVGIGSWGIDPAVLSALTKGESEKDAKVYEKNFMEIFQQLLNELIARIAKSNYDFIYAEPVPFEFKAIVDCLQKEWIVLNKNVENFVRMIGREAIKVVKEKIGMNILEEQAAKLIAGLKSERIESGKLREAKKEEFPKIVEILNNYTKLHELARFWTIEEFQRYLKAFEGVNTKDHESKAEFPETPFGWGITVWDDAGEIKAAIVWELNEMFFRNGYSPVLWIHQVGFTEAILNQDPKEVKRAKVAFMSSFLAQFHLKVYICHVPMPYYDEKVFDGFMGERRTTPLLMHALTDKAKPLCELKKLKQFYLPAIEFKIH